MAVLPTTQPFRLLDLPAELRLIVYESIEPMTSQRVLTRVDVNLPTSQWPNAPHSPQSAIFFARSCLPVALLATCKQFKCKAEKIIQNKMSELVQQPVRYLADYSGANALAHAEGPLHSCVDRHAYP
jgi:hypothetical protein